MTEILFLQQDFVYSKVIQQAAHTIQIQTLELQTTKQQHSCEDEPKILEATLPDTIPRNQISSSHQ